MKQSDIEAINKLKVGETHSAREPGRDAVEIMAVFGGHVWSSVRGSGDVRWSHFVPQQNQQAMSKRG